MTSSDDRFDIYVKWAQAVFLTQNNLQVQAFKQRMELALGSEESRSVVLVTLCGLAESHPHAFTWTIHHYDTALYAEFGRNIIHYTLRWLIDAGFFPGKDFSQLADGCLLMKPALKKQVLRDQSAFLSALMQEFLHTPSDLKGHHARPCYVQLREDV